ncbi:hypothetical protein GE21DRAFT_4956 [Neurospora crassa]|uniref:Myb-like domain-containing protein n=1 Tax=Neurospora crassa (strain ATCC 24698 / 74-OR23-1A / CBS 708.71 / DSM 1257 / FGSC 987) TaxID=367110 RepID=Q7S322_NEUCR|nr:hypothetical protein NCU07525 [Neurospora crassa OR74A]EAA29802.1 hypothetical protein NCU07525 [Neurospora crassa OR74A]KHE80142.1 hypothetical protein GE21DRAFT_4956 [Neurospora crassa]|eukprot:XP_959038.1 hypothetical protein NCU07525 [Neurospora crassa OR74A]
MSASSPSVGATWSESSPEYETCRQHEGHGNSNNNTSSSFNRPSTGSNPSNDAQSFSPTSDASWGSSPAPIQGSYMDLSDTIATTTTTSASITSPHSNSGMSAYPGHQQQQQQQQQATELSQHGLTDASACLQGTVETDTLFNDASGAPPNQQTLPNFGVVWTSAPSSSQPSIISASSPFVASHQAQPRWHNLHQYSVSGEPMLDEPRLSSSLSLDNMSEGGMSTMPPSPIDPFHSIGAGTGHHSLPLGYDGLPSPTHSSFGVGPSSSNGGVSLQHQHQQQQYPSVMLNDSGLPFDNTGGSNFSNHPSLSPSSSGASGGDVLFRGPISNRTVFDYPPSGSSHLQHDANVALKAEGPLAVAPTSLWLNNPHHKTPTPHPSPESSPIGANSFFHQNQMPLPLEFGSSNAHFGTSPHINTSQLHPHYVQQQQASNRAQRKSLPHHPPHRGMGGGGRPSSPRYNPAVMTTREMLPSHPNSPSMAWAHHQGQGHPHGLPHQHPLMMKPNTIPSHHRQQPHASLASMSSHSRRQQPFHHGVHPYHSLPSSASKRRNQGHQDHVTDHLKRARAEQDALLVKLRNQGKSYKQIRQIGRFTEAESTLRGRYRTLTKSREQRVRRPEWTDKDLRLLEKAVREFAKGPLSVTYSNPSNPTSSSSSSSSAGPPSTTTTTTAPTDEAMSITSLVSTSRDTTSATSPSPSSSSSTTHPAAAQKPSTPKGIPTTTTKIPWKQVSHYIFSKGGSYKFGNATVRKRWEELMRDQLAKGKDLQKPFYEQRSKRSAYSHLLSTSHSHSHSQSLSQASASSASASGFVASRGAASTRQAQRAAGVGEDRGTSMVKREPASSSSSSSSSFVKTERREEEKDNNNNNNNNVNDGDGNLAYSDWLDMSVLGDDAEENHNHNGNGNGTDGDGEYELSDASDSEEDDEEDEEEEEEEEEEDSDGDYMEE